LISSIAERFTTKAVDRSIDGVSTVKEFVDLIDSGERTDLQQEIDWSTTERSIDSSSKEIDRSVQQQVG
jgi:hypothetical protein